MTTYINDKRPYESPELEIVMLDNEISLVLATNPPGGPGESTPENKDQYNESPWE
jgi:hypothetical protein